MTRVLDTRCEGDCHVHGRWSVSVETVTPTHQPLADECPACRDVRIEDAIDADGGMGEIDPWHLLRKDS